jgi:nucleotide-binding universal stress UspA family protein
MFPFRKILFPVDYSDPCQAVVPYAKEMVRHFSADLALVHAYGGEVLAHSSLPLIAPELMDEARSREEQRVRDFAQETFPGQHVETFAEPGETGSVVHKIVQHYGTDLVMLATHGHGPVRRLLLGSVAAKVLHDVSAAVWTGTGAALTEHAPRIPCKSVLCALNDTDEAEAVLRIAAAFACEFKANLWLVHVIETPPAALEIDFSPYREALADAADFRMRELKGHLNISAPHSVVDGRVADALCEEAARRRADLIITGRGGVQGTFTRVWSHVYPIVRESPCPVLSI